MISNEKGKVTKHNNKEEKKQLLISTIILIILLGITAGVLTGWVINATLQSTKQANQNTKIKTKLHIGVIIPITGNHASDGRNIQKITQLIQEEMNTNNGIANKPIKFIYEDGQCNKEKAEQAAKKLIQKDKVELLYAGICEEEIHGAASIAQTYKIITITTRALNQTINNISKYVITTAISGTQEGKIIANVAYARLKSKKGALLYEDTRHAKHASETFKKEFVDNKGNVVFEETYENNKTQFDATAQKIKQAEPNIIYLISDSKIPAILAIKALEKNNVNTPILTNMKLLSQEEITKHSKILEGIIGIQPYINTTAEKYKKFNQKFIEKFGHEPAYPAELSDIYNLITAFKVTYEKANTPNADQKIRYMQNLLQRDGVANQITFDDNKDNITRTYGIYKIINNKLELIDTLETL